MQLVALPFEKQNELRQLTKDASKLERDISFNIQEKQMKQHDVTDENSVEAIEVPVVKMEVMCKDLMHLDKQ